MRHGVIPMTATSLERKRLVEPGRDLRRHDYLGHWKAITRRLSLSSSASELSLAIAEETLCITGATSVAVYLAEDGKGTYRLSASAGTPAGSAALVTALRSRTTLLGFIVLGPRRTGADYPPAARQLLVTVAQQAAAFIMADRLSEASARPCRLERAAVMHDIKNSVSALSLLARNAAGNFSDPEFQRDALATLTRTVARMQGLLVKLSSPGGASQPSRREPIDLRQLIIEATVPLAASDRVQLVRRLHPVRPVYGDREALLSVVENLTTNAAEAIDHEGTVTVTLAEEHGHAVISVTDTGCGIPDDYQARHLFTPFRSTKNGGWGVGLYHVKQLVERQAGEILVESAEGRGTTFTVKLPLQTGQ
jgi:hypothetical protein